MSTATRWLLVLALSAHATVAWGQRPQADDAPVSSYRGMTDAEVDAMERRIKATVREMGVVESGDVIELRSQLQDPTSVVTMVPDGSVVRKGDVLLTLDDSALQNALLEQRILTKRAEASLAKAKMEAESARERMRAVVSIAQFQLRVAELARKRYLEEGGELECELAAADRAIALAEQRVKENSQEQKSTGAPNPSSISEAKAELERARAAKRLLTDHVRQHQTAVLELAVSEAELSLHEKQGLAVSAAQDGEADSKAQQSNLELQQHQQREIEQQIENCRILAPRDGMVMPVRADRRLDAVAIGTTVRPKQLLLTMPDVARLRMRALVHESTVGKVRVGQTATLELDAFPATKFAGRVIDIGRTPEPTTFVDPDVVRYAAIVEIADPPSGIKLGMTGLVAIDAASGPAQ